MVKPNPSIEAGETPQGSHGSKNVRSALTLVSTGAPNGKLVGPPVVKSKVRLAAPELATNLKLTSQGSVVSNLHHVGSSSKNRPFTVPVKVAGSGCAKEEEDKECIKVEVAYGVVMKRKIGKASVAVPEYEGISTVPKKVKNTGTVSTSKDKKCNGAGDKSSKANYSKHKVNENVSKPGTKKVIEKQPLARSSPSGSATVASESTSKCTSAKASVNIANPEVEVSKSNGKEDKSSERCIKSNEVSGESLVLSSVSAPVTKVQGSSTVPSNSSSAQDANNLKANGSADKKRKIPKSIIPERDQPKKKTEKEKNYDPAEVKLYMEKQKEIRRLKQLEEDEKRRKLQEKKMVKLKQLDETCKELANKSVKSRKSLPIKVLTPSASLLKMATEARVNFNRNQKNHVTHSGGFVKSNAHIKTASAAEAKVLEEYGEVLKKEFLGVLEAKQGGQEPTKVDKAIETEPTNLTQTGKSCTTYNSKKSILDPKLPEKAAAKIQAGFRGYKLRKILREANLLPFVNSRFSSYFCDAASFNFQSPMRNSGFLSTPKRRRSGSFDEPYPVEAIKKLRDLQQQQKMQISIPRRFSSPSLGTVRAFEPKLPSTPTQNRRFVTNVANSVKTPRLIEPVFPTINDVLNIKFKSMKQRQEEQQTQTSNQINSVQTSKKESEEVYATDFESCDMSTCSSALDNNGEKVEEDITDTYFGPSNASSMLSPQDPSRASQKRKKAPKKSFIHDESDSSTTVDTDVELKLHDKTQRKLSEDNLSGVTSTTVTGSSSNLSAMPAPVLNLRYQTEKEKYDLLNKALLVTTNYEKEMRSRKRQTEPSTTKPKETIATNFLDLLELHNLKKYTEEKIAEEARWRTAQEEKYKYEREKEQSSAQLALAECQKEAIKATAELTKWISEFKRHSVEQERQTLTHTSQDLAAVVYAAVEGAKKIGEERNCERRRSSERDMKRKRDRICSDVDDNESSRSNKRRQVQKVYFKDEQVQFPSLRQNLSCGDRKEVRKLGENDTLEDDGSKGEESFLYDDTFESEMGSTHKGDDDEQSEEDSAPPQDVASVADLTTSVPLEDDIVSLSGPKNDANESLLSIPQSEDLDTSDSHVVLKTPEEALKTHEEISNTLEDVLKTPEKVLKTPEEVFSENEKESKEVILSEKNAHVVEESPSVILSEKTPNVCSSIRSTEDPEETADDKSKVDLPNVNDKSLIQEENSEVDFVHSEQSEWIEVSSDHSVPSILKHVESTEANKQYEAAVQIVPQDDKDRSHSPEQENTAGQSKLQGNDIDTTDKQDNLVEKLEIKTFVGDTENLEKDVSLEIPSEIIEEEEEQEDENSIDKETNKKDEELFSNALPVSKSQEEAEKSDDKLKYSSSDSEDEVKRPEKSPEAEIASTGLETSGIGNNFEEIDNKKTICGLDSQQENFVSLTEKPELEKEKKPETEYETKAEESYEIEACDNLVSTEKPNDSTDQEISHYDDSFESEKESVSARTQSAPEADVKNDEKFDEATDTDKELSKAETIEPKASNATDVPEVNENILNESMEENNEIPEEAPKTPDFTDIFKTTPTDYTEKPEKSSPLEPNPLAASNLTKDFDSNLDEDDPYWFPELLPKPQKKPEDEFRISSPSLSESIEAFALKRDPEAPPPEYSSLLHSQSITSQTPQFALLVEDTQLQTWITNYVEEIWECYETSGKIPAVPNPIIEFLSETKNDSYDNNNSMLATNDMELKAQNSFKTLASDLIKELVQNVLQIKDSKTSYVDFVRCGPIGLLARKSKIPKTKEKLVNAVLAEMLSHLPSNMVTCSTGVEPSKPYSKKCARPADIVDDILMEEMIRDEVQWSELWPEENLVKMRTCSRVIQAMIKNVLRSYEIAHLQ